MADELDDSFFAEEPSDIDETESIFDDEIDELDEIIIESSDESGSNRPFLLSLLGLLGIGVGAFLCLGLFQLFGIGGGGDPVVSDDMLTVTAQVVAIVQTNEAIATQNVYVTQTIEAREATATANAILPTSTPDPTETPVPTNSPVPAAASGGSEAEDQEDSTGGDNGDTGSTTGDTDENNADGGSGTDTGSGSGDETDTSAGGGSDSEGGDTNAENGSGEDSDTADDQTALPEQLPDTGFSVGLTLALAFGLLILLFGARRLRTM